MRGLFGILQTWIPLLFQLAAPAVLAWIASRLGANGLDKARQLSHIADEVAAFVVLQSKGSPWAVLVQEVVRILSTTAGVPTSNAAILERAATAALLRAGLKP